MPPDIASPLSPRVAAAARIGTAPEPAQESHGADHNHSRMRRWSGSRLLHLGQSRRLVGTNDDSRMAHLFPLLGFGRAASFLLHYRGRDRNKKRRDASARRDERVDVLFYKKYAPPKSDENRQRLRATSDICTKCRCRFVQQMSGKLNRQKRFWIERVKVLSVLQLKNRKCVVAHVLLQTSRRRCWAVRLIHYWTSVVNQVSATISRDRTVCRSVTSLVALLCFHHVGLPPSDSAPPI